MLIPYFLDDEPVWNSNPIPFPTPVLIVSGSKFVYFGILGAQNQRLFPNREIDNDPKGVFSNTFFDRL